MKRIRGKKLPLTAGSSSGKAEGSFTDDASHAATGLVQKITQSSK